MIFHACTSLDLENSKARQGSESLLFLCFGSFDQNICSLHVNVPLPSHNQHNGKEAWSCFCTKHLHFESCLTFVGGNQHL